ncbi:unnamed protein product [Nippostrongylus brasiliensis]|uniref:Peroxisomal carnitine O-octanoyltransferase (inferred by orthology to a human protein) n=1 Tax=Nippostrongylus brasiliensis TaxID=27835 RepID=A0A0N4Y0A3_NIPBR|nr:unnamed protein product [Nippostrongylus brasiliensis]
MAKTATFSKQNDLPSLPVPDLDETLDKYLKSALVLLDADRRKKTIEAVEVFRNSQTAKTLQSALVNRAGQMRNWLDEWWYDAYTEVRLPLVPYLSIAAGNSVWTPLEGSQLCRAADAAFFWMHFWDRIRKQILPITSSRGTTWDMNQYYCLFNACRVPALPKDRMDRYFRTESEGDCPSHIVVLCRGNVWKMEMLRNGQLKTSDEIYHTLRYIDRHSEEEKYSVASLTTENRDTWAKIRASMIAATENNAECFKAVEQAAFVLTLADESYDSDEYLHAALMGESHLQWADKSVNVVICKDGRHLIQGEHSNTDAIVIVHVGDDAALRARKHIWTAQEVPYDIPTLLEFDVTPKHLNAIADAKKNFQALKSSFRAKSVEFNGFGSDLARKGKLYVDTIIQIALQLAFLRTHGSFAPIYETASTRKFFHGRTETVRGCTQEMVEFGKAVMAGKSADELRRLFAAAYMAHNKLMEDAMEGKGIDRHLYGLRKTLEMHQKGCSPKINTPLIFSDDAWKIAGGDGNFLLSTSLIGYMGENDELGGHGYVAAMRADGYGAFYRIGKNKLQVTLSDWKNTKSDIDAYGENFKWALTKLSTLFTVNSSI